MSLDLGCRPSASAEDVPLDLGCRTSASAVDVSLGLVCRPSASAVVLTQHQPRYSSLKMQKK